MAPCQVYGSDLGVLLGYPPQDLPFLPHCLQRSNLDRVTTQLKWEILAVLQERRAHMVMDLEGAGAGRFTRCVRLKRRKWVLEEYTRYVNTSLMWRGDTRAGLLLLVFLVVVFPSENAIYNRGWWSPSGRSHSGTFSVVLTESQPIAMHQAVQDNEIHLSWLSLYFPPFFVPLSRDLILDKWHDHKYMCQLCFWIW